MGEGEDGGYDASAASGGPGFEAFEESSSGSNARGPPDEAALREMIAAHESMRRGADTRSTGPRRTHDRKIRVTEARIRTPVLPMARPRRTPGTPSSSPAAPTDPADFTGRSPHPVLHPPSHRRRGRRGRGVARARARDGHQGRQRGRAAGAGRGGARGEARGVRHRGGGGAAGAEGEEEERNELMLRRRASFQFSFTRLVFLVYEIFARILPSLPASLSRVRTVVLATFDAGIRLQGRPSLLAHPFVSSRRPSFDECAFPRR